MNNIIQQIAEEFVSEVLNKVQVDRIINLDELSTEVLSLCKGTAVKMVEEVIRMLNQLIRDDKAGRKKLGLTIKEKNRTRRYITHIGEINFEYDYMYDSINKCYSAPLFSLLGIESKERVSKGLLATLVDNAAFMSYAKSAEVTDSDISRQTVCNAIKQTDVEECIEEAAEKKKCETLHIFADEDHIHLQKQKDKKSQMIPLVVVTEGMKRVSKDRNQTLNPRRFVADDFDTKGLWESVDGYILANYDLKFLKKIYVHGDGGQWIKQGLEEYTQTIAVMDAYHIEKRMTTIANAFPGHNIRKRIYSAVDADNKDKAIAIIQGLYDECDSKKSTEKVDEFWKYISNNWESIRNRRVLQFPGSCTEGLVSHILADRFSSRPLGWSLKGAGKLSKARVYRLNGNRITRDNIKIRHKSGINYRDYAKKVFDENLSGKLDYSIFEKEIPVVDMSNPTMQTISRIGNCKSLAI